MLLAIDIGNTSIAIGVFEGQSLVQNWKIQSERERTSDEYGITLLNLLSVSGLEVSSIKSAILSSVVPPLTPVFQELTRHIFQIKALVVGPGLKTGMPILYENPLDVGADRVVSAVAAYSKYGGPSIVVDFGTATTFDAVSSEGEYLGGAIAPGMQIAAEALYRKTAKLPRIEIRKPRKTIGRTTETSMQSGLYYGYIGLISRIIEEMKKDTEWTDFSSLKPIIIGVCWGDGIGEIISKHAQKVLEHVLKEEVAGGKVTFKDIAGLTIENRAAQKKAIPDDVLEEIKSCHVILKGPTTTPQAGDKWPNIESANVAMRRYLDLFANVRPVRIPKEGIDWCFFRENTEGAYVLGSRGFDVSKAISTFSARSGYPICLRSIALARIIEQGSANLARPSFTMRGALP